MELIDRATKIAQTLSDASEGMSVTDIAAEVSLAPSTVHRILNSLKKNKLVLQDDQTRLYRLGYKMLSLCSNILSNDCLTATARPFMRSLADKIGKTVVLCVMENDHIINIDCVEQRDSNLFMVKIGREIPLFATSAGRVYCAYMNPETAKNLYDKMSEKAFTPYTKTEWWELEEELNEIRKKGFACIDEELQMGMQGYAAPIFDQKQRVVGALAFTTVKHEQNHTEDRVNDLILCANNISAEIG